MSRERAEKEPYFAVGIERMTGAGQRFTRGLYRLIQRSPELKPYFWLGSGWRTGSVEHNSGRALDVMFVFNTGRKPSDNERKAMLKLVEFMLKHGKAIGLQWMLVSRDGKPRTESYNFDRGTWRALANRGSVSANHVDHIHFYLKANAQGWSAHLDTLSVGEVAVASAPKTAPGGGIQRTLKRGSNGDDVLQLQRELIRIFPVYAKKPIESNGGPNKNFGPATERVVKEFQSRASLVVDGIVGRRTFSAMRRYGMRV